MKKILICMVILVIFPFYLFSQTLETIGKVIDKTKFQIETSTQNSATDKVWTAKSDYGKINLGTDWDELVIITDNKDIVKIIIYIKSFEYYSKNEWGSEKASIDDYFYTNGCREKKNGKLDSSSSSLIKGILIGSPIYMYEIPNSNILGLFVDNFSNLTMTLMFISKSNTTLKFITDKTEPVEESLMSLMKKNLW